MKLPCGYVLIGEEIVMHKEKADIVRNIFEIMAMTEEEINKVKKFKFPNQSKL